VKRNSPLSSSEVQKNGLKKVPAAAAATLEGLKKKNKELDNKKHQENVTKQIRT
jgi:hypothetical protein